MNHLAGRDCSRIEPAPNEEEREWLLRLSRAIHAGDHLLAFSDARDDDDDVVYCERDGAWWCGRYVGTIAFEDRRLTIAPRFGLDALGHWLEVALDLRFTDTAGNAQAHEAFLPQLLARLWGNSISRAARHGLPGLRVDVEHHGLVARGRVDVRRTIDQRVRGRPGLASVHRERSLDNPIVHAIVAAQGALNRRLGPLALKRLLPERARDVLTAFSGVNPSRRIPDAGEVASIRFTPITAGYRGLVRLSLAIARNRGFFADTDPEGGSSGVLVDVAEIWELFVVESLRRAFPNAAVIHGTRELESSGHLLSNRTGAVLGRLFPDALVSASTSSVVADAKYKSLRPTRSHPSGASREDLYQMRAYLSHWSKAKMGMLVYPQDAEVPPSIVADAPWFLDDGRELRFMWLAITADSAVKQLQQADLIDGHSLPEKNRATRAG